MSTREPQLDLLHRFFEEATRLHGDDAEKVASSVKARIEALGACDRAVVDEAFERMLAFSRELHLPRAH